ncbi:MAG: hypothetical protein RQ767_00160 [Thermovirgaceae bacterium]|nr:hypothetical protein [Thermovirgaceae bacterium]
MRAKRKALIMAVALAAILATANMGFSHPPTSIELEYSADDGVLSILIAHPVGDVSTHFIKKVDVKVDGRVAADLFYIGQIEKSGEKVSVTIGNFKPGTDVSVIAECNKFGMIEKNLLL